MKRSYTEFLEDILDATTEIGLFVRLSILYWYAIPNCYFVDYIVQTIDFA